MKSEGFLNKFHVAKCPPAFGIHHHHHHRRRRRRQAFKQLRQSLPILASVLQKSLERSSRPALGPISLLLKEYRRYFPGGKVAGVCS